jgi:RNA polymerase sigma factor (sigma-70 family)
MKNTVDPHPFGAAHTADDKADTELCARSSDGDVEALAELVRRHRRWIYNLAIRLVLSPVDAEDLTQDALVRIITHLSTFKGKAAFRTWAYRIVVNTFLDGKKRKTEQAMTSFAAFGENLDKLPVEQLMLPAELEPDRAIIVEDAKIGCMLGMLLCLDREQRIAYVLGEIFQAPSNVAGEILEISPATFRKRLQRARRDLTSFMNEKCGLVNPDNPCRCEKKTRSLIRAGWVDPRRRQFTDRHVSRIRDLAPAQSQALAEYAELFRDHPFLDGPDLAARLTELVQDPNLRRTCGLED